MPATAATATSSSSSSAPQRGTERTRSRSTRSGSGLEPSSAAASSRTRQTRPDAAEVKDATPKRARLERRKAPAVGDVRSARARPKGEKSTEDAAAASASSSSSIIKEEQPAETISKKKKKVAVASKPLDIPNCGICFEESFKYAGVLNCCKHGYCFECITKWAQDNSNTCPQCKQRIDEIAKTEVETGKRIGRVKKIKRRDLSSGYGLTGGVLGGPTDILQAILGGGGFHGNLLYQLFMDGNLYEEEDDEEEDDEYYDEDPWFGDMDYSDADDEEDVCHFCGREFSAFLHVCPHCEYEDGSSDDEVNSEDDDDHTRSGTRENPIELD